MRLHQSYAKRMLGECPSVLKFAIDNGIASSRAMTRGTLVDQLVLGGRNIHVINCTVPSTGKRATDYKSPVARDQRDMALKRGQVPAFPEELEELEELAGYVRSCIERHMTSETGIRNAFELATKQEVAQWESPEGIECEGTPDMWFADKAFHNYDLKFGESANPDRLDDKAIEMYWDVQAAAYEERYNAECARAGLRPKPYRHWLVACQDDSDLKLCTVVPFDVSMMDHGRSRWRRLKNKWQWCLSRNEWPDYVARPLAPKKYHLEREYAQEG